MVVKNKIEKSKNSWNTIKKTLKTSSSSDLIDLMSELYLLSKDNQDFLNARFIETEDVIQRCKDKIRQYLAPLDPCKSSQQVSLKNAKKVISDYKKASNNKMGLIDLMIHYVESGTDFTLTYGDLYSQYYLSLESVFDSALKIMKPLDQKDRKSFISRLETVVKKSSSMGWGYYDYISETLDTFLEEIK